MKDDLLTIQEAAEYIGLSVQTIRKLQFRGELFPEYQPIGGGRGGARYMYLRQDLDDARKLYPTYSREEYMTRKEAADFIGIDPRRINIKSVKELCKGKFIGLYKREEVKKQKEERDRRLSVPKGYIRFREAARILNSESAATRARRKNLVRSIKSETGCAFYNLEDIIRLAHERRTQIPNA